MPTKRKLAFWNTEAGKVERKKEIAATVEWIKTHDYADHAHWLTREHVLHFIGLAGIEGVPKTFDAEFEAELGRRARTRKVNPKQISKISPLPAQCPRVGSSRALRGDALIGDRTRINQGHVAGRSKRILPVRGRDRAGRAGST